MTRKGILDRDLPSLKQEKQSNAILNSNLINPLSTAIEELSNSIIELKKGSKSEKDISSALSRLNSGFIEIDTNSETMVSDLLKLHDTLLEIDSKTNSFLTTAIESNQYLSDLDKTLYKSAIVDAKSLDELKNLKVEAIKQSSNAKFLTKSLSSLSLDIKGSNKLSKEQSSGLLAKIDSLGTNFYESGEVNVLEIKNLIDEVKSLKTEDGSQAVELSDESILEKAFKSKALGDSLQLLKEKGVESLDFATVSSTQIDTLLTPVSSTLSDNFKLQIESLTKTLLEKSIDSDQYSKSLLDIFTKSGKTDQDSLNMLSELSQRLSVISENTNPMTDELSNADKIRKQDELEVIQANNDKLSNLLEGIETDRKVKGSVVEGVSSMEELGATLAEKLLGPLEDAQQQESSPLDALLGDSKKKKSGKAKGRFGKGLSKAASVGKGALKIVPGLAAAAAVGMSAYDYSQAENKSEKKQAVGSGVGSVIGGALGAFGGPLGIMAGAAVGNWLGGKVGEYFSNPQDFIPDEIRAQGTSMEAKYIDEVLRPTIVSKIANGTGEYTPNDLKELDDYRSTLSKEASNDEQFKEVDNLISQGMTNPVHIAAATGLDVKSINSRMSGPKTQFKQTPTKFDTSKIESKNAQTQQVQQQSSPTIVTQTVNTGSGGSSARISDQGLNLLSYMV